MKDPNKDESFEEEEEVEEESNNVYQRAFKNKFNSSEINDIQSEIQGMTKKIEHEKINLRICTERYDKKFVTYSELQGRPFSKEEKEKERVKNKKKKKNHKVSDPIERKKLKDKKILENQGKILKANSKNEGELGELTNELNELVLSNQALKEEIKDLRKQKSTAMNQRDKTSD